MGRGEGEGRGVSTGLGQGRILRTTTPPLLVSFRVEGATGPTQDAPCHSCSSCGRHPGHRPGHHGPQRRRHQRRPPAGSRCCSHPRHRGCPEPCGPCGRARSEWACSPTPWNGSTPGCRGRNTGWGVECGGAWERSEHGGRGVGGPGITLPCPLSRHSLSHRVDKVLLAVAACDRLILAVNGSVRRHDRVGLKKELLGWWRQNINPKSYTVKFCNV